MSKPTIDATNAPAPLTREGVNSILDHLSQKIGAALELDEFNSVSLSYHEDNESTLVFFEPLGLLALATPIADPESIDVARLRDLLELNTEWTRPSTVIIPESASQAHYATILPADPDNPALLEQWLADSLNDAGELACMARVTELRAAQNNRAGKLA